MPLITKDEITYVECLCGATHKSYAGHYGHMDRCPITRCAHCLTMIELDSYRRYPTNHECAAIKLMRLEHEGKILP